MKRLLLITCLWCVTEIVYAQTDSVITENFDWNTEGNICMAGTSPTREKVRKSLTNGFTWGGYNANRSATGGSIYAPLGYLEMQGIGSNASNVTGSYVYTIFSSNGVPSRSIDLSKYGATFKLFFHKEASPNQSFRLMVRDEDGDWYLSETDYRKGVWPVTGRSLGTPLVPGEILKGKHKGYPISAMRWRKITEPTELILNKLLKDDDVALQLEAGYAAPNLELVTGAGIYVEGPSTGNGLLSLDWFQLNSREPIVKYNPAYSSHYIEMNYVNPNTQVAEPVKWGFSNIGGGACGEFYFHATGLQENLNGAGWGRAFQSAFRSRYHKGDYNPTQGGRTRTYGTTARVTYKLTADGRNKITFGPFQVATMGKPEKDILTFWDLTNGEMPGKEDEGDGQDSTKGADNDCREEVAGMTEKDEIMTEFFMEGYYEDVSSIIKSGAKGIRIYNQYSYTGTPGMIRQYETALGCAYDPFRDYPKNVPVFWGDRLFTDKFNKAWILDKYENWTNPTIPEVNVPSDFETRQKDLMILTNNDNNSIPVGVGIYFPLWSSTNQFCVQVVDKLTNQAIDSANRMEANTLEFRYGHRGKGSKFQEQGSGDIIGDFIKRDIGFTVTSITPPTETTYERLRFELFQLVGTPNQIKAAARDLENHFSTANQRIAQSKPSQINEEQVMTIYPNPAQQKFTIDLPNENAHVIIMDASGRIMFDQISVSSTLEIDNKDFPGGVYLVRMVSKSLGVITQKVIITK